MYTNIIIYWGQYVTIAFNVSCLAHSESQWMTVEAMFSTLSSFKRTLDFSILVYRNKDY